jgi:hypothetical protein
MKNHKIIITLLITFFSINSLISETAVPSEVAKVSKISITTTDISDVFIYAWQAKKITNLLAKTENTEKIDDNIMKQLKLVTGLGTNADCRSTSYHGIINYLKKRNVPGSKRKTLVNLLTLALNDTDTHIKNNIPYSIVVNSKYFKPEDFDDEARNRIKNALNREPTPPLILLGGLINIIPELTVDKVKPYTYGGRRNPSSNGWALEMAKARNGDKKSIEFIINTLENNTNLTYRVSQFNLYLPYIPQPEIMEYLIKYLNLISDTKTLGCEARWGYVDVLLIYAKMIENFPLTYIECGAAGMKELEMCREWAKNQKTWKFIEKVHD